MSQHPRVLMVGAGLAGLTLAQGLRQRSIAFRLFERRPRSYGSQGHRFRISKDGQTRFRQTAAERYRFEPRYADARNLDYPEPTPVDPVTLPLDRTWILQLLSLGLDNAIEYEREFESYEIVDGLVHLNLTDGSVARGEVLVGADGIKSRVRKQLQPRRKLLDLERWIMWGRTPLTTELKESLLPDLLSWCMYMDHEANVQAVVEPMMWSKNVRQVSANRLPGFSDYVYWVLCAAPFQYASQLPKTVDGKATYLQKMSEPWHRDLRLLFDSAAHDLSACVPAISSKPDIEIVSADQTGRATLIGDAAHAMSPMGGSGGDVAIRNAADLARTIAEEGVGHKTLAGFEVRMEERAKDKIEHSFRGGQKFWRGKEWTEYDEIDV
ncbi:FAD/NAD(P)-binding domain-containing protein [Xylaria sp. FL1042]|nr:FAD/NAD(P)-binding domain-containing protein [Xylaria sp. FL1042]